MKKFAVVLCGCGPMDGSEIHESVMTLLAIDRNECQYTIFAPDADQFHVVNHYTKQVMNEKGWYQLKPAQPQDVQTVTASNAQPSTVNAQQAESDSTYMKPIVYEDAELATILSDMATFYQVEPVYKKAESKHIRLYFTWDKKQALDDIIDTFNKFERIHITRDNQKLIVE